MKGGGGGGISSNYSAGSGSTPTEQPLSSGFVVVGEAKHVHELWVTHWGTNEWQESRFQADVGRFLVSGLLVCG